MTDPKPNILVEVTISAPIDTVWKAVRDPEQINEWFGWESDTLTDEIAMIFGSPVVVDEQAHKLKFGEWEGIADGFELIERDGKTILRVVRFGTLPQDWDNVYSDVREGWMTFAHQLQLWVERHHGQQRRTVYLADPTPVGGEQLSDALGLRALWDTDAGSTHLSNLPGDTLEVSRAYRSGFQLGLHVPAWGDGLSPHAGTCRPS
ncbi:MAG: SRPBCC domain-containing protein [Nannocystaceae bacterium]|nr:SRPBCC domain-containing protein [Nannocystaceae bacterium]